MQLALQIWRSSTQLHNGPFCSCRKIGEKAAVQQSPSRWARKTPSLKMNNLNVTVHEKRKVSEEQLDPAAAHHTIMTARCPDNTLSSAPVWSQSIQFIACPRFVLLCFNKWYWGIIMVLGITVPGFPRVSRPQIIIWGGRILTLHLNCVAGYTSPLLFLFERTQQLTQKSPRKPWRK